MRSIWKGSISFGLVSIPIRVVSATQSHSVSFHQVHVKDGGRIRYRKVCELDGEEVAAEEIGKGFENVDGTTVQLTDTDLAALPLPTAKTVEIVGFVPAEDVDPIQLDRSYYLAGDGQSAAKPYALLREALRRSGKVAVGKLAMRGRESLGLLRVYGDVLALHTMLWPDEIREPRGVAPETDVTVRDAELDLADTLMETLGELDWAELRDEYREAVVQLVEAKAQGADTEEAGRAAAAAARQGQVVDLMAVLENSVRAARESRGEDGAAAGGGGGGGGGDGADGGGDEAAGAEATVHELPSQGKKAARSRATSTRGRAAKKTASGGRRSAATAKEAPVRSSRAAPAKKAAGRGAAARTGGEEQPAKKASARGAKKATAKATQAKKAPAKATQAKKGARPRRSA